MPDSLLSRFDLIFLVNDSRDFDVQVARHVLENHINSQTEAALQGAGAEHGGRTAPKPSKQAEKCLFKEININNFLIYNQEQHKPLLDRFKKLVRDAGQAKPQRFLLTSTFLNNLIQFCKARSGERPYLSPEAVKAVSEFYGKLRKNESRGLLVTARALESMIRLSTALAKLSWPVRDVSRADVVEAYVLVRHSLFGESEEEIRRTVHAERNARAHAGAKQPDDDKGLRYDLFMQAFGEIIERLGGNNIKFATLKQELAAWIDEHKDIGQPPFSAQEFTEFLEKMVEGVAGMVVENDTVYF